MDEELLQKAEEVLKNNWQGQVSRSPGIKGNDQGFTVPSKSLYPNQWSWDSCFHVIGWAHLSMDHAWTELETLFAYQWQNGMLPQIVFHNKAEGEYFPDYHYWNLDLPTSALIQPPMHAIACWYLYEHADDKDKAKEYLSHLYGHLIAWHKHLLEFRDPEGSGLITVLHPWETGLDNSPRWDEVMDRIEVEQSIMPDYQRVDKDKVEDPNSRPTDDEYEKYVYLIELYRQYDFDAKKFYEHSPFLVKDVVANSIFYAANLYLQRIAAVLGEDDTEIAGWKKTIEENFMGYFCPEPRSGTLFYDYDVRRQDYIKKRTAASLIPLYTGIPSHQQAREMCQWISHPHFGGNESGQPGLIPSTALEQEGFQTVTYWRGPVWVNLNWLVYKGLLNYDLKEQARLVRDSILKLVDWNGFYEYYDPFNGKGLGAKDFSWTASLLIDLIKDSAD